MGGSKDDVAMNLQMIISSFLSGLLGAMGFGGGTVLVIYLTGFLALEQKEAQGINLVFFLLTGIFAACTNIKKGLIDKKSFLKLIKSALPGMLLGFILLPIIPSELLRKFFGGALLILGLKTLFEKNKSPQTDENGTEQSQ